MATTDSQSTIEAPKVWQSLKTCLAPEDYDIKFWWQLTGYQLAHMVEAAGYTLSKQYEILLFHYHWIVSSPIFPFARSILTCN